MMKMCFLLPLLSRFLALVGQDCVEFFFRQQKKSTLCGDLPGTLICGLWAARWRSVGLS